MVEVATSLPVCKEWSAVNLSVLLPAVITSKESLAFPLSSPMLHRALPSYISFSDVQITMLKSSTEKRNAVLRLFWTGQFITSVIVKQVIKLFWFKANLDRTAHLKFDPTVFQTNDLQITDSTFHVPETFALTSSYMVEWIAHRTPTAEDHDLCLNQYKANIPCGIIKCSCGAGLY